MNDVAVSTPVAAPVVPAAVTAQPVAVTTEGTGSADMTWEQIKAEASQRMAGGETSQSGQAAAAAAETSDWQKELPKPKVHSASERIAAKLAAQREAAQRAPLEQQLAAERARFSQFTESQQRADAEYSRLIEAGDVDGALKVKGLSHGLQDLQRTMLRAKGALPPPDPRFDSLKAELDALKTEKQAREAAENEARSRSQSQQQWQQDVAAVSSEIAALPLPGAAMFAKAPNVAEAVTRTLVNDPTLTVRQAAAMVYADYQALDNSLSQIFRGASPQAQVQSQPSILQRPTQAIPVNGGAAPNLGIPDDLPEKERWELIKQQARGR